jgi:16S rRNA (guanine(966)-N(2))-methyltransferase RsmD
MRIIGGSYKSKQFHPPSNNPARPTTDFAKEGLFNVINNEYYFDDISFLDLFAGTGSISYEMASRGCTDIDCVELHGPNIEFINQTAVAIKSNLRTHQTDVFQYIKNCSRKYKVIFAGPPYPLPNIPEIVTLVFEHNLLENEGTFILETNPQHKFDDHPYFVKKKNYGTTIFHFFEIKQPNQ